MGEQQRLLERKPVLLKPKIVKIERWINLLPGEKKISGLLIIRHNGQPQSNWKVTCAGYPMTKASGSEWYSMGKKPYTTQPGNIVKVVMTPPAGLLLQNPRMTTAGVAVPPKPLIATARICKITRIIYPKNRSGVSLRQLGYGNLKVSWNMVNLGNEYFTLYEMVSRGNYKKVYEKKLGPKDTSVAIPRNIIKAKKRYKITLLQNCNTFKYNMKVAQGSWLDLMIYIDSYFYTTL